MALTISPAITSPPAADTSSCDCDCDYNHCDQGRDATTSQVATLLAS